MENWSKYLKWEPESVFYPTSEEEICLIIQKAIQQNKKVRVIGSGHSFTPLCKVDDFLISLDEYQGIINIDKASNQVTVKAGTKLHHLNKLLNEAGLALENLGDIDVQSVAGSISTGTHGTGTSFGNLCTQVRKIKFVNGLGQLMSCSREDNPELFKAAVLSLGLLGVITEVTIQCIPKYNLALQVRKAKLEDVLNSLSDFNTGNRHFEFYWFPNTPLVMTKELNASEQPASTNGFSEYVQEMLLENYAFKMICETSYRFPSLTRKLSNFAASTISDFKKIKRSYEAFSTKRIVRFNEMEYNVPVEAYPEVKKELVRWINKHNYDVLFPIENRFVKKDDIYLSPAYQRDSAYIAVHVYHKKDFHQYFSALEAIFKAYDGRPHWGKMHTLTGADFANLYPEYERFRTIRRQQDPKAIFLSPYMKTIADLPLSKNKTKNDF